MVAVIGDVHGCYYTLKNLFEKVKSKYPTISVYCVGDLVDRGNFSFEVVEFLKDNNISFTAGNHDYMFYYYFTKPASQIAKIWIYNGAETTIRSYENRMHRINEHLHFIKDAPLMINLNDCFISHAGISKVLKNKLPNDILNNLDEVNDFMKSDIMNIHGILWTRDQLLNIDKLQIVGHTRQLNIKQDEESNSIYIDTGAVTPNKLTAVIIEENNLIDTISVKTFAEDVSGL